jgi:hypothetical protein
VLEIYGLVEPFNWARKLKAEEFQIILRALGDQLPTAEIVKPK